MPAGITFHPEDPHAYQGFAAQTMFYPYINDTGDALIGTTFRVRASNFGVQIKQEITYPELIDGIVDRSAYQLGIQQVEGDITFPLIHEGLSVVQNQSGYPSDKSSGCGVSTNQSFVSTLWQMAAQRDKHARMANSMDIGVIYPDNSSFTFPACQINNMSMKVNQGAAVEVTVGVIGGSTVLGNGVDYSSRIIGLQSSGFNNSGWQPNFLSPARIITWNDFQLAVYSQGTAMLKNGNGVRSFNVDIKNNIERYTTLNGSLAAQDIAPKKREISGSFKLLGRNIWMNNWSTSNETRFTSDEHIAFGYSIGPTNIYWATALHGVIFKMEEMTISPSEVFESTINFNANGDCSYNYDATQLGASGIGPKVSGLPAISGSSSPYGNKTRSEYASGSFFGWSG